MAERIPAPMVGAPDPEKRNSLIIDEFGGDEIEGVDPETVEFAGCYFNDVSYASGKYVCSGDELLRCDRGKWVRMGSCDPDNP